MPDTGDLSPVDYQALITALQMAEAEGRYVKAWQLRRSLKQAKQQDIVKRERRLRRKAAADRAIAETYGHPDDE